jgi:hypothetical protein
MNNTRQRGTLRPEIAALISMLAEAAIADYFAEIESEFATDNSAQHSGPPEARANPLPDSSNHEASP